MNQNVTKLSEKLTARYTYRFPLTYIILAIGSLLFVLYDFLNHIFITLDFFLIIGIGYYLYSLFLYTGDRQISIKNNQLYFNNRPVNQRIKHVRRLDANHVEIRFNMLWVMIVKGKESDIDRFFSLFQQ